FSVRNPTHHKPAKPPNRRHLTKETPPACSPRIGNVGGANGVPNGVNHWRHKLFQNCWHSLQMSAKKFSIPSCEQENRSYVAARCWRGDQSATNKPRLSNSVGGLP